MSTHTPGPWRLEGDGNTGSIEVLAEGHNVASVFGGSVRVSELKRLPSIRRANAHLIAAAPLLLHALKAVTDGMDRAGGDGYGMPECPWCKSQSEDKEHQHAADCELHVARIAIAKAEGR